MQDASLYLGDWRLDLHANSISNGPRTLRLEHKQVQLLLLLIAHCQRPVSKQELLDKIWAGRVVVDDVLAVAVSQLRKALQDNARAPKFIKTIPGVGYQFILPLRRQDIDRAGRYIGETNTPGSEPVAITLASADASSGHPASKIISWSFGVTVIGVLLACMWLAARQVAPDPPVSSSQRGHVVSKYEQALQLSYLFTSESRQQAMILLEEIVRLAPDYADAYVLLARVKRDQLYHNLQASQNASEELKALLNKALEFDPENSNAYQALGNIAMFLDWDFPLARTHIEQAIALNDNNAEAHHLYGLYWLAYGNFAKSYRHIVRARELNPLYYSIAAVAWVLAMQGNTEEAWLETEKLLAYRPDDLQYHRSALRLFEIAGDEPKAYQHLRAILELAAYTPEELAALDGIFSRDHLPGVYQWLAFARADQRDIGFYAPPLSFARFAIGAGRYDEAFTWLAQAGRIRQREMLWLAVDPKYDPIRQDPRFSDLIRDLKLPH